MTPHSSPWVLDVEAIGPTMVVRFLPPAGRDDTIGYALGVYLLALAEEGATHMVLNFGAVDYVNSLLLGKVFVLAKKVKGLGGQLILCRVRPTVYDLFALVKLVPLVPVVGTEEEALATLETKPSRRVPRPVRHVPQQEPEAATLVDSPVHGVPVPGWCASS
jgi:anti-sigma B factor antagonist